MSEERAQLPFEATMPPRRWMGAAAIVAGLFHVAILVHLNLTVSLTSSHLSLTMLDLAFRAGLILLAAHFMLCAISEGMGELARWTLRITTTRLEYLRPAWQARWPRWGGVPTMAIDAGAVRRLAWDGYDNIGIELKSGQIVTVHFRNRLAKDLHAGSRLAVLAFVAQASGEPLPPPPLEVAPWVMRDPARARV